jgi:photosystem II stability/assembly factor-like uncharacterized protein
MLTEHELTAEIRAGLEAVTPPAPWLPERVEKRLRASVQRSMKETPLGFQLGLNIIAVVLLIVLAVTAVGVFLAMHRPIVTVGPGSGPVIFPTKMITPTTGWALVGTSELWRTTDGGASWTDVSPPHLADRVVDADANYFLDEKRAWITESGGGRPGDPALYWVTFRTVDGGRTWQQGTPLPDLFKAGFPAQEYFLDADTGWLVLSNDNPSNPTWPILYGTHDGGLHWSLITSKAGAGTSVGTAIPCGASVMFSSAATGWMSLSLCERVPSQNQATVPDLSLVRDLILVTHDGGVTWQIQTFSFSLPADSSFHQPVFFDQLNGIIVVSGPHPALLATSDGGGTWNVRSLPGESQRDVDFVDPYHGWTLAGPSSMFAKAEVSQQRIPLPLYRTDDGGSTWTPVRTNLLLESPAGVAFSSFYFVDQKTGFLTLFTQAVGPSEFLKTTDGGGTWNVVRVCKAGLGNTYPPPPCPS